MVPATAQVPRAFSSRARGLPSWVAPSWGHGGLQAVCSLLLALRPGRELGSGLPQSQVLLPNWEQEGRTRSPAIPSVYLQNHSRDRQAVSEAQAGSGAATLQPLLALAPAVLAGTVAGTLFAEAVQTHASR